MSQPLASLAALARAGAVERAWSLFESGGYAAQAHDPAALVVKGRLLKGRARQTHGAERQRLMAQAAAAYGAAHGLTPAPYLAINAATLSLLAGERARAEDGARAVLALLDAPEPPADTPYFLAATRAEALLLLGDASAASAALEQAASHDPDGWDDRAATLAQLREIIAEQRGDDGWLAPFAPPTSLHYAGHMGLAAGGAGETQLAIALDRLLPGLGIGFAWGALAAGADIVIAERLLAAGAELHAVLPCPVDQFEAQSVAPAGPEWTGRFRAVLATAASLRIAGSDAASVHDPLATAFAGELAIGGAVLNAARFGTAVSQLIVCDEHGGGTNTARQAALWQPVLGEQHRLAVPRDAAVEALFPPEQPDPARQLALHVAIGLDELVKLTPSPAEIATLTAPVGKALAALPSGTVRARAGLWEFTTADVGAGLGAIAAVLEACRTAGTSCPAIGAHLAIGPVLADPASGTAVPYGPAPGLARRLMQLAPAGMALASDPLAVAVAASGAGPIRSELYLPDEPDLGGAIHALLTSDQ